MSPAHDSRDPTVDDARTWLQSNEPTLVLEVVEARGSVPRGAGTCMLVSAQAVLGTIGGGHLEFRSLQLARDRLARQDVSLLDWRVALGPSLGQCCGGALTLRLRPLTPMLLETWPRPAPLFRLQLHGAGHVGRAIVRHLNHLPCEVLWVDEREDAFPDDILMAGAARISAHVCDAPEEAVNLAQPEDFFLVLTHRHDLDLRIIEAVLRRGDFGFAGLIGSLTKRAKFLHRLQIRQVPLEFIERLTCPIGIAGIEGKEPDMIAISVVAQLLQQLQKAPTPFANASSALSTNERRQRDPSFTE